MGRTGPVDTCTGLKGDNVVHAVRSCTVNVGFSHIVSIGCNGLLGSTTNAHSCATVTIKQIVAYILKVMMVHRHRVEGFGRAPFCEMVNEFASTNMRTR